MAENFCVQSKVREQIRKSGLRMSSDAIDALNKHIEDVLKKAAERCKGNKRQTIRREDF